MCVCDSLCDAGESAEPCINPQAEHRSRCGRTLLQMAVRDICQVCDPALEAIKDVGCVDDGGSADLALFYEELQQVQAAHNVQVHSDLIQQ